MVNPMRTLLSPVFQHLGIRSYRSKTEEAMVRFSTSLTEEQKEKFFKIPEYLPRGRITYQIEDFKFDDPKGFFYLSSPEDPNRFELNPEQCYEEADVAILFDGEHARRLVPKTNDVDLVALDKDSGELLYHHSGETLMVREG